MKMEEEISAVKRNAERFGQLFQLISEGVALVLPFILHNASLYFPLI
jgi:hypothetical protein